MNLSVRSAFGVVSLALFALVSNASAQVVHVVNGTGAALGLAVGAAANGDTLLVRGGPYDSLNVSAKQLTVVADVAGRVTCGALTVANLAFDQHVTILGFDFGAPSTVTSCTGAVRVEDCSFHSASSQPALRVTSCSDVAVARAGLIATTPPAAGTPSGDGLVLEASTLALYDSTCIGANGVNWGLVFTSQLNLYNGRAGGAGARSNTASTVFASGTSFVGGNGGIGHNLFCIPEFQFNGAGIGGAGGEGLAHTGTARMLDCSFTGGTGGAGGTGGQCCVGCTVYANAQTGVAGQPTLNTVTSLAGASVSLAGPRIIRESSSIDLTVTGTPGDQVWLAFSGLPRWSFDVAYSGVFLYSTMLRRKYLGTIPAGGVLNASLPWGALPAGVDATLRHMQAVTRTSTGAFVLSAPTYLVIADSAF